MGVMKVGNWSVNLDSDSPGIVYKDQDDPLDYIIALDRLEEKDWTYHLNEKKIYSAQEIQDFIELLKRIDAGGHAKVDPHNFSTQSPY